MRLNDLLKKLKSMPLTVGLGEQVEILQSRYGEEYTKIAEDILELFEILNLDVVKTSRKYIYDYLKQLEYFLENQDYGHVDFNEIKKDIYDNEKVMLETYMPGLLLSYVYTTILYEKNHLFLREFISRLDESMQGIEIGFGEGFYIWEIFKYYQNIRIYGYDISPYAIQFATNILKAEGCASDRYFLQYGNVFQGIPQMDGVMDFGVLAEVIEHIPSPSLGIQETVRMLRKGGILYLTTVINSNHMDHISNFENPFVVEEMLEQNGMRIIAKKIYRMTDDFPESRDISVGLAYVAEKI